MLNLKKIFGEKAQKPIIGRVEKINIPKLNLYEIDAKIDTGAYRGSIHAENIKVVRNKKNNKKYLKFNVLDENNNDIDGKAHKVSNFKTVKVRTSQTEFEKRYAIPLEIEIAGKKIKTELSLSSRKDLRYSVLIGRKPLKKKFLVDVDKK